MIFDWSGKTFAKALRGIPRIYPDVVCSREPIECDRGEFPVWLECSAYGPEYILHHYVLVREIGPGRFGVIL